MLLQGTALGNLVLGQVLSVCITISGAINQKLNRDYLLDLAAIQTTLVYVVVAVLFWLALMHFSVEYFWTRKFRSKIPITVVTSLLDTAASVLALHSYQHLNVPMVALLSTVATPTVMFLSRIFLKAKYRWTSIAGASIAISGVISLSIYQLFFESSAAMSTTGSGILSSRRSFTNQSK
jgi:drug/metabolite transporter (DMT)-like permease